MIIFGSRTVSRPRGQSMFFCPVCRTRRNGSHIVHTRYFTLYFLPIFPLGGSTDSICCMECGQSFTAEVMNVQPHLVAQVNSGLDEIRRAMLLVMIQAGRTDELQLSRVLEWCREIGLAVATQEQLRNELKMALQAGTSFAQFAQARLGQLSPRQREHFVVAAKRLLAGSFRLEPKDEDVLRHVAFQLNVSPRFVTGG
jgi:hypothetical protein